jgi:hypothetical protein
LASVIARFFLGGASVFSASGGASNGGCGGAGSAGGGGAGASLSGEGGCCGSSSTTGSTMIFLFGIAVYLSYDTKFFVNYRKTSKS